MITLFFLAYGTVFAAEVVGDKLVYTTGVLATRYRALSIMVGTTLAFMIKMGVAVLAGEALSKVSPVRVAAVSAVSFLWLAILLWRKDDTRPPASRDDRGPSGVFVAFVATVFSEWHDIGQMTAAGLATRYDAPLTIWLAAVAAMMTKALLAVSIGAGVRRVALQRVPMHQVRLGTVVFLLALGILTAFETLESGR